MKERTFNTKGIFYLVFCVTAALTGATLNFFLLRDHTDATNVDGTHTALLLQKGFFSSFFISFAVCAIVVLFSALLLYKKHTVVRGARSSPLVSFFGAAAGLSMLVLPVMQFVLNTTGTPYAMEGGEFSLRNPATVQTFALIFSLPGSAVFLLPLFCDTNKKVPRALYVTAGLFSVFFCVAELLVIYEFMNDFLYGPLRIYAICSYSALIFCTLSRIRLSLEGRAIPASFAATGLVAFFVTFTEALPKLILSFMKVPGFAIGPDSFYTMFRLFAGAFALVSVIPTLLYAKKRIAAPKAAGEEKEADPTDKTAPEEALEPAAETAPEEALDPAAETAPEEALDPAGETAPEEALDPAGETAPEAAPDAAFDPEAKPAVEPAEAETHASPAPEPVKGPAPTDEP